MTGVQDVIMLSCDDCRGNHENYSFEPLCPFCADIGSLSSWLSGVPFRRKAVDGQADDAYIVRQFDRRDDIVAAQLIRVCKNLKSTQSAARCRVDHWRSLAVPTTSVNACTQPVIRRITAAAQAVNQHLPDAVFDPAERVLNPGYAFGSVEQGKGRLIP